jgi:fatty acid-binding protein DegV
MLSIKPIIEIRDGVVEPVGKVRTRSKALRALADRLPSSGAEKICVVHANAPDFDEFYAMVEPMAAGSELIKGDIGPVIGVHGGPRTMGLGWIERA